MRIADGYMLKEIAGNYVVIPVGQNIVDYKSMLHLNETGAFIWQQLEKDVTYQELTDAMAKQYEATEDEKNLIESDLKEFIQHLDRMNLLIHESKEG